MKVFSVLIKVNFQILAIIIKNNNNNKINNKLMIVLPKNN